MRFFVFRWFSEFRDVLTAKCGYDIRILLLFLVR